MGIFAVREVKQVAQQLTMLLLEGAVRILGAVAIKPYCNLFPYDNSLRLKTNVNETTKMSLTQLKMSLTELKKSWRTSIVNENKMCLRTQQRTRLRVLKGKNNVLRMGG